MEKDGKEEEVERWKEAAPTKIPLLPNLKSSKITQAQLDKFMELHERCLQLKERSKSKAEHKENASRSKKAFAKDIIDNKDSEGKSLSISLEDRKFSVSKKKPSLDETSATKKKRKLHWGLDTKERWERKSNM